MSRLDEIKARAEQVHWTSTSIEQAMARMASSAADVPWLVSEVERLTAERDALAAAHARESEKVWKVEEVMDDIEGSDPTTWERLRDAFADTEADTSGTQTTDRTGVQVMEPIQIAMQIAEDAEVEEALSLAFDDAMQAGTLTEGGRIEMSTIARRGLSRAGLLDGFYGPEGMLCFVCRPRCLCGCGAPSDDWDDSCDCDECPEHGDPDGGDRG